MNYRHHDLPSSSPDASRFFSEEDCRHIARRLAAFAHGGGTVTTCISSWWRGNVRWARNRVTLSGDIRNNFIQLNRSINGATSDAVVVNDTSDAGLIAALRRSERLVQGASERSYSDYGTRFAIEPMPKIEQFSDATFALTEDARAQAAHDLSRAATQAGLLSAGYLEAAAYSTAVFDSYGRFRYIPYTQARYSITVRDPAGNASGWAGQDHWDWQKIDAPALSATALDKCMHARGPSRIEPGRYTTILEPQAVCDFVGQLVCGDNRGTDRYFTESDAGMPFWKSTNTSQLGDQVVDARISITTDPSDPGMAYPPASLFGSSVDADISHATAWIKNGVLVNLAYGSAYGIEELGRDTGMPNYGGFRMSGGTTSIEEMVATTKRGLLVTRFSDVICLQGRSQLYRGYTRDGLWLIEDGKRTRPVKNLAFTESILGALNNVEQLGVPRRVFHPRSELFFMIPAPVIVPALKIRDFSFTSLTDAI